MYLSLACIFRRFGGDLELWDTFWDRDIAVKRDLFNAQPGVDSKGLRIKVRTQ